MFLLSQIHFYKVSCIFI